MHDEKSHLTGCEEASQGTAPTRLVTRTNRAESDTSPHPSAHTRELTQSHKFAAAQLRRQVMIGWPTVVHSIGIDLGGTPKTAGEVSPAPSVSSVLVDLAFYDCSRPDNFDSIWNLSCSCSIVLFLFGRILIFYFYRGLFSYFGGFAVANNDKPFKVSMIASVLLPFSVAG